MKAKFLFLLIILATPLFFAVSCADDEEEEGAAFTRCNSNVDCTRDSYCDLDNPQQDDDLGTIVYYCRKRQLCATQADCPISWKCKISEGFCITNKEADGVMCKSNDDCQDPSYPKCNLATGECAPDDGGDSDPTDDSDVPDSSDTQPDDSDSDEPDTSDDSDSASDDEPDTAAEVGEIILTEDFEESGDNWTIVPASEGYPCWEIGAPTTGPAEAHGGTNVAATILGGEYLDNCNDLLKRTSGVSIPSEGKPEITFYAWVDIKGLGYSPYYDYVEVLIKQDGEMWETTSGLYLSADTPSTSSALDNSGTKITKELGTAYYKFTGDLSAYKGKSVEIAFRFISDGSDHKDGFYLDDITVSY